MNGISLSNKDGRAYTTTSITTFMSNNNYCQKMKELTGLINKYIELKGFSSRSYLFKSINHFSLVADKATKKDINSQSKLHYDCSNKIRFLVDFIRCEKGFPVRNSGDKNCYPYRQTGISVQSHFEGKSRSHERWGENGQKLVVFLWEIRVENEEIIDTAFFSEALKYIFTEGLSIIFKLPSNVLSNDVIDFLDSTSMKMNLALATIDVKVSSSVFLIFLFIYSFFIHLFFLCINTYSNISTKNR
jgi:hypothetical protein